METRNLRRKDTTKGPPLRVLSLDGGGIRGFSMLIILQELMYRTYVECEGKAPKKSEIPKPCEHFDLIVGTGTGGLIALMLGRLRLDIETCKQVYATMTRHVFETDKRIAGIPYRSTLFKASKLEDAIKRCVQEHTVFESEGNDGSPPPVRDYINSSQIGFSSNRQSQRRLSRASLSGPRPSSPPSPSSVRSSTFTNGSIWGNPDAPLYDNREDRTKTAVTAVYKGTPKSGGAILLRSYDSRKEPPPEFNCTIWQAGRATSATGLAFKPIQIGQHVFVDEGAGKYNPAPLALDEAVINEWPGRELGIFVSVGTGKRPPNSKHLEHEWWEDLFADSLGNFAEAKRRLLSKIEGCEETHQYMLKEHLEKRNVAKENYYRLNVEVGVGEFGMNEWNRLADISTNTRMYLGKNHVQGMTFHAAVKLAKIKRIYQRLESRVPRPAAPAAAPPSGEVEDYSRRPVPPVPAANSVPRPLPPVPPVPPVPSVPLVPSVPVPPPRVAFELPADEIIPPISQQPQSRFSHGPPHSQPFESQPLRPYSLQANSHSPSISGNSTPNRPSTSSSQHTPPGSPPLSNTPLRSSDTFPSVAPIPPPIPPKTPIPFSDGNLPTAAAELESANPLPIPPRSPHRSERPKPFTDSFSKTSSDPSYPTRPRIVLPYPDDEPPPAVNRLRKPKYNGV